MQHDITDASLPIIYIVGPSLLQNQLLAQCLEEELNVECACLTDPAAQDMGDKSLGRVSVLLLDCFKRKTTETEKCLETYSAQRTNTLLTVLFNVEPADRMEKLVRNHKVRGVFYQKDTRQVFLKGMQAILKGDLWFSRRLLSECVLSFKGSSDADNRAMPPLSVREKEVLRSVALGFSNDEIAEKMRVSPHTIKTHLYHIYKKIGVHNRLQATLWAAAYLC